MSDKKISQLTALAASGVAPSTDVMAIVDTSATETKKITAKDVVDGALNTQSANGVVYLNGSKEATAGSVVTYDGTTFKVDGAAVFNDSGANVDFRIEGDTDSNLLFVDASTDRVGMGTNTPAAKLTVNDANGIPILMGDIAAAPASQTAVYVGASTSALSGGNGDLVLAPRTSDARSILFYTGNGTSALRATLNASGNLGLGVTPSAWGSIYKNLDLNTYGAVGATTSVLAIKANAFYNGTNDIYKTTSQASQYVQAGGVHSWHTAASGTAGNTITFTQAMTLNASGNLGVGTTSPAYRLQVETASATGNIVGYFRQGSGAVATILSTTDLVGFGNGATAGETRIFADGGSGFVTFRTNNTERARITSGGDFCVGGTTALNSSRLTVQKDVSDNIAVFDNTAASSPYGLQLRYSGATPNGTSNEFLAAYDNFPTVSLRFSVRSNGGIANYQANDANLSDERVKKDIAPLGSMWDKLKAIEIVTFKYKDQTHDDDNIGVIAQQVESVAPEFVDVDGWDKEPPEDGVPLKTIYTTDLYHAAIKALQEAMTRIEELEAKVAALEAK